MNKVLKIGFLLTTLSFSSVFSQENKNHLNEEAVDNIKIKQTIDESKNKFLDNPFATAIGITFTAGSGMSFLQWISTVKKIETYQELAKTILAKQVTAREVASGAQTLAEEGARNLFREILETGTFKPQTNHWEYIRAIHIHLMSKFKIKGIDSFYSMVSTKETREAMKVLTENYAHMIDEVGKIANNLPANISSTDYVVKFINLKTVLEKLYFVANYSSIVARMNANSLSSMQNLNPLVSLIFADRSIDGNTYAKLAEDVLKPQELESLMKKVAENMDELFEVSTRNFLKENGYSAQSMERLSKFFGDLDNIKGALKKAAVESQDQLKNLIDESANISGKISGLSKFAKYCKVAGGLFAGGAISAFVYAYFENDEVANHTQINEVETLLDASSSNLLGENENGLIYNSQVVSKSMLNEFNQILKGSIIELNATSCEVQEEIGLI